MKIRLDKLLLERGLAASRERAQAMILAGRVLVDGQKVEKAGAAVTAEAEIRLLGEDLKYVSRGGLKLEKALEHWQVEVAGRVCVDVGASTGGFTDCLLQAGAARVIAIDTGYGQMAARLRSDPRVRLLERTNARYLKPDDIAEAASLVCVDVSFISATLVLPAVMRAVASRRSPVASGGGRDARLTAGETPALLELIVLVKPQFEAGREKVGKGGIVRDPEVQQAAVEKVRRAVEELGGHDLEVIESPILGAEGNREFLLYARFG
jgi:23S rRNA (cytidine1920-2'-O)/16S rRNA (cytidine1409-2'-O)-methyltransferase